MGLKLETDLSVLSLICMKISVSSTIRYYAFRNMFLRDVSVSINQRAYISRHCARPRLCTYGASEEAEADMPDSKCSQLLARLMEQDSIN